MRNNKESGIVVAGTGPAGLLAALALARADVAVTLVGPQIAAQDRRTTALMTPALTFLETLGLLETLTDAAAPLRTMRIVDGTRRLVRSPVVTFRAAEIGNEHFGLNIPNQALLGALEREIRSSPIDWRMTTVDTWDLREDGVQARLANGDTLDGGLVIAADGRNSPARAAAGIDVSTRTYPQAALVLNFSHDRSHGFISTEFHTETGPFTQVPLPGKRSSLVWVLAPDTAAELYARDDQSLSRIVEDRMQSMLGRVAVEPGRQVYPLSATLPALFARNRAMLVGEAAHVFPPIGAQGLNLGIRDVEDMVKVVCEHANDPGAPAALHRFDTLRRPDVTARSMGVNLLNRSLLSDMLPAQLARGLGLSLLGSLSPLRAFFMREGLTPGAGLRGLFSDLREQIRR